MEKTTTIRLEINGEPAKNTLDELRQRAEILSQKIRAIKLPANERLMSNVYGLTDSQSKELKRLEREYAAVTAEIEKQEEALRVVNSVRQFSELTSVAHTLLSK